jgi:hypothetical protein
VRHALAGDFTGTLDAFSLRFQSSKIPTRALKGLYDQGLVAVYAQVSNPVDIPAALNLPTLVVRDRTGATLSAVDPRDLPDRYSAVAASQAIIGLAVVAVMVVAVAADRKAGRNPISNLFGPWGAPGHVPAVPSAPLEESVLGNAEADRVLLRYEVFPPYTAKEGLLFFRLSDAPAMDWSTATLAMKH